MPADGARKPDIRAMRVVLPAPLGPSRPVTPGRTVIEMPLTATTLPYQREAWSIGDARSCRGHPSGSARPGRPGTRPRGRRTRPRRRAASARRSVGSGRRRRSTSTSARGRASTARRARRPRRPGRGPPRRRCAWIAVTMPLPMSSSAMVATTANPRRVDHDAISPATPASDRASSTASPSGDGGLARSARRRRAHRAAPRHTGSGSGAAGRPGWPRAATPQRAMA